MKWPRWIPRLSLEISGSVVPAPDAAVPVDEPRKLGIRPVGHCEVCGREMEARTRKEAYRGRVDCDCGHRNHVDYREVRGGQPGVPRHVTVSTSRRFEAATHDPDLRLAWRYGTCPSCSMAVRLIDAFVIAHEDAHGSVETFAYYCTACHVHDDPRRGRLIGHDGAHIVDTLRFMVRPH